MSTSEEQGTPPANHDQAPRDVAEEAAAEFLRPLSCLRLHPLHWGANQTVQRTGASRHAEWRCGGPGWLAPVADLGVGHPRQTKNHDT
jgi:hypothetical protein